MGKVKIYCAIKFLLIKDLKFIFLLSLYFCFIGINMKEDIVIHSESDLRSRIYIIRGKQVMLDFDLAEIYGYSVKAFNQQVKNNIEKFDDDFRFQLNAEEVVELSRSKFLTSMQVKGVKGGRSYFPYAFTEQGVAMLASVLKSDTAVLTSIMIIDAFVALRRFLQNNSKIFTEIDSIKKHQREYDSHLLEHGRKIDELFDKMDKYKIEDKQGIFFQGQIFDAYAKFESFIAEAENLWLEGGILPYKSDSSHGFELF